MTDSIDPIWVEALESTISLEQPFSPERTGEVQADGRSIDPTREMTREAFFISLTAFQIALTENQYEVHLRDTESTMHSRSTTEYLLKLVGELQIESAQLIAEGCTQEKGTVHNQSKQSSYVAQLSLADDPSTYADAVADAVRQLAHYGIDMTIADGNFRPDQLLTQAEYFSVLRQIDRLWAARFGADSIIIGYPDYAEITPVVREELDAELGELFPRIARVRYLIDTFCKSEVSLILDEAAVAKSSNTFAAQAFQNRLAKVTERKTTSNIQEILDIHPEDVVFSALVYLIGDWGVEVILQPDGSTDLEGTITIGEAAIYTAKLVNMYVQTLGGYFSEYEFSSIYQQLTEELEELEALLQE